MRVPVTVVGEATNMFGDREGPKNATIFFSSRTIQQMPSFGVVTFGSLDVEPLSLRLGVCPHVGPR